MKAPAFDYIRMHAEDFFTGLYETAIEPGEILSAIWAPRRRPGQYFLFDELTRRRGDYAMIGLALAAELHGTRVEEISLAFLAGGPAPMRARAAEDVLRGAILNGDSIEAARHALEVNIEPGDDPSLPSPTRLHLARVLLGRLLEQLRALASAAGASAS